MSRYEEQRKRRKGENEMSSTNTIINLKPCNYGCGTRIY